MHIILFNQPNELDSLLRELREHALQIFHLVRIFAFRLQEEWMLILVGEGDELGFDGAMSVVIVSQKLVKQCI